MEDTKILFTKSGNYSSDILFIVVHVFFGFLIIYRAIFLREQKALEHEEEF